MELYQLRTFVTVAEQGHITQAAEVLHLSQPAVTAQIKALEEELGLPLFERTAGGVALTRAGEELMPTARQILEGARGLRDQATGLRGEIRGRLTLGTIMEPGLLRLGPLARALGEKFPLLAIDFRQSVAGQVLNQVRKKEIDGGFYLGANPYSNVDMLPLGRIGFSVIAPADWRAKVEGKSWKEVGKLPWVGSSQFTGYHKVTQDCFRAHNINPRRALEVDYEGSFVEMVASGVGLALVREPLAAEAEAAGRVFRWQQDCTEAGLSFVYAAENRNSLVLAEVLRQVRAIWQLPEAE